MRKVFLVSRVRTSFILQSFPTLRRSFPRHTRCLSNRPGTPHSDSENAISSGKKEKQVNTISHLSAGLPDWIEHWNRENFKNVGYGLATATVITTLPLPLMTITSPYMLLPTVVLGSVTGVYWWIGLCDIKQTQQTIRRNFPVLGNMRYLLESIRPEIRQYFVEGDNEEAPFSRQHRGVAYRRSKGVNCTIPFGTTRNTQAVGYEWINHSLYPTEHLPEQRVLIGANNPQVTTQPYSSSILNISAMSYGALSDRAILALSRGAQLGNFSHNTGEGGISKFHKEGGADLIWNIGTAYFGCGSFGPNGKRIFDPSLFQKNSEHVKMIEIKLSQGAKPAHGGMLPKEKITRSIADARNLPFPVTQDCNSPARHSAFSNPQELCDFIAELRTLSGGKPVGIKLCIGQPEEFTELVHTFLKTGIHPDFITVDGAEGGTGAAPPEFSNSVGTPLNEGLSFVHAVLVGAGLRNPTDKSKSKVALIASGKVLSGFSMYKNFALGADVCNAARSFLFSLGCIQALKCNTNTCPTGITTQNPELTWGLDPSTKQVRVANFHRQTVHACVELMQATGVDSWSNIQPHHVNKRIQIGQSRHLGEVYSHLMVKEGELLQGSGPERLLTAWDLEDNIIARTV